MNIWKVVGSVVVKPAIMAVGWTRDASMVTAVLSHGKICVWRLFENADGTLDIREMKPNTSPPHRFGNMLNGAVKCASMAPGGTAVDCVALLTVLEEKPSHVYVWHISPSADGEFEDGQGLR